MRTSMRKVYHNRRYLTTGSGKAPWLKPRGLAFHPAAGYPLGAVRAFTPKGKHPLGHDISCPHERRTIGLMNQARIAVDAPLAGAPADRRTTPRGAIDNGRRTTNGQRATGASCNRTTQRAARAPARPAAA